MRLNISNYLKLENSIITCAHGPHPRVDGQRGAGCHARVLSNGRVHGRRHHGRRVEVSPAVLRDDVTSADARARRLELVVEVRRGVGGGRGLACVRVEAARVGPERRRRGRLAAVERSVPGEGGRRRRRRLLLQLALVTSGVQVEAAVGRRVACPGARRRRRRHVELERRSAGVVDLVNRG